MKPMRYLPLLLILGLALFLVACEAKDPQAVVDKADFDFGTVEQNTDVNHTYIITNKGDKDLEIKRTRTTCGCTVAQPSKKLVKKGETVEIQVTFSAGARKGAQNKKITVFTNDPKNERLTLTISGTIIERLAFDPQRLRFNDVEPGEDLTETVTVTNSGSRPITISELKIAKPDELKAAIDFNGQSTLPITVKEKEQFKITFTLNLPKDQAFFHSRIDLVPQDAPDNSVIYYVSGRQKGAVEKAKKVGNVNSKFSTTANPGEKMTKIKKMKKKQNDE